MGVVGGFVTIAVIFQTEAQTVRGFAFASKALCECLVKIDSMPSNAFEVGRFATTPGSSRFQLTIQISDAHQSAIVVFQSFNEIIVRGILETQLEPVEQPLASARLGKLRLGQN